jgi:hypothetical protein
MREPLSLERALGLLFIAAPIVSLGLNLVSWLRYGLDLPFLDDWTDYFFQRAISLQFSHLFARGNDTLYPVGRALDVAAQYTLGGNGVAYQFFSMLILLGGILYLQWKLLYLATSDWFVAACAFAFSVLITEPYTYWGLQNEAYIQGVPILCIMATVYIALKPGSNSRAKVVLAALLTLIGGLSYISGAAASIGVAAILILFAVKDNEEPRRSHLFLVGATTIIVGAVCLLIQSLDIILYQGGGLHRKDAFWSFPFEADYWLFMLGKIGRALGLPHTNPRAVFPIACIVAIGAAVLFMIFIIMLMRNRLQGRNYTLGLVFCTISIAAFICLNLVSAGRAKLRPPNVQSPLEVFAFGFENRFHFFWATPVWALGVAAILSALLGVRWISSRRWLLAVAPLIFLPLSIAEGAWNNAADYRGIADWRTREFVCLQAQIDRGEGIKCPDVFPLDLAKAYVYARSIDASFVRYLPIRPRQMGLQPPDSVWRLSTAAPDSIQTINAEVERNTNGSLTFKNKGGAALIFDADNPTIYKNCVVLQVSATIKTDRLNYAVFFFKESGQADFDAAHLRSQIVAQNGETTTTVDFLVDSLTGFSDHFRLNPVAGTQPFSIGEIEVSCRLRA